MEQKTKLTAEDGKPFIEVSREFDLPLDLLFKAFEDPEIVGEWMGTKVLKLENRKHGSYQFETIDPKGNRYGFNGAIHEFIPNQKITRTFEMENTPFSVQLEFLEFEKIDDETSLLRIHTVYRSTEHRDQMLKIGMAPGMNAAHNRLQKVLEKLK
jgi:uncharacterized protein YndB with AHSA1/START domain